jgi:pimeloyl-ACP methyl ester carboxylesterase
MPGHPPGTGKEALGMECELRDITVHYEAFGEGRPIVVLHGWGCDHRHVMTDMEPVFSQREGWRRIYPDLPGHGGTPGSDRITNQDGMLDVVLEFIDTVIPGQRFLVAGASAGAYLARGVVHHRTASVDGLLLNVPLIVADGAERHVPSPVVLAADAALVSELEPDEADGLFGLAVVQTREVLEYIRTSFPSNGDVCDEDFLATIRDHPENYAFSFDVDALPEPFPSPTLIVTGRQDFVTGYLDAWGILEDYPRATFAVLDRAGHMLAGEQPDLFRALVGEWLDRVEEYAG